MVEKEIDSLCSQYGLKPTSLFDLMLKVNFPDPDLEYGFTEEENSLYLPLHEKLNAVSSLPGTGGNFRVYIQLVLDPEKASSGYLADFFNNPLGLKVRKAWEARGFILRPETREPEEPATALSEVLALHNTAEDASFSGESGFSRIISPLAANETKFAGEASVENMCAETEENTSVLSGSAVPLLPGISSFPDVDLDSLTHSKLYLPDLQIQLEVLKIKNITKELISQLSVFECRLSTYPKSITHIRKKLELIREAVKLENDSDYILELIRRGESKKLEFKSTLRMNLITEKPDWNIEHAVLKTIIAYLNTDGGILLVGVSNSGEVLGIKKDGFPNEDKFLLHFKQLIKQHIGLNYAPMIEYTLVPVNGKKVLEIDCKKSDKAVFLNPNKNNEEFYIRIGPSSERLTGSKLIEYVNRQYNGKPE
ncbi:MULTISPECIES: helix-turn-helix domain-containing protein [unclassified Methanosarcina]|uniref:AlbA family DNA-binding domain-containing protein n=1 Tax=unclassified Methanosarcina TaxID=2644672 RepID=UPI00064ED865|nr:MULTISPECIES: ATP-binding protein [unclassified Methanosarcina]